MVMACIAFVTAVSCIHGNDPETNSHKVGDAVQFSISTPKTKTQYTADDAWQIEWTIGDQITIYCYNEEKNTFDSAVYDVVNLNGKDANITPVDPDNQLIWQGTGNHDFYAVYGYGIEVTKKGVAYLPWNIQSQTAVPDYADDTDATYSFEGDMSRAYMAAVVHATPSDNGGKGVVELLFKPLMTTLDITVNGDKDRALYVSGLRVTTDGYNYTESDGTIGYDLNKEEIISDRNRGNEQIQINIQNGDGSTVLLNKDESVKFTVILPPMPIDKDNRLKIEVTAMDLNSNRSVHNVATFGSAQQHLDASAKVRVSLPAWQDQSRDYRDWIGDLPDNLYVSMMTIPGTNYSGSYSEGSFRTQSLTIKEQLENGVRALICRPKQFNSSILGFTTNVRVSESGPDGKEIPVQWLNAEAPKNKINSGYENARQSIEDFLNAHPSEFVFLFLDQNAAQETWGRHPDFTYIFNGEKKDVSGWGDIDSYYNKSKGILKTWYDNPNHHCSLIPWSPDLTVGEARGNIIVISIAAAESIYQTVSGYILDWPTGEAETTIKAEGSKDQATVFVQNFLSGNGSSFEELKTGAVTKYYKFSANDRNINHWYMNNTAASKGKSDNTNGHIDNAVVMNAHLNDIMLDPEGKYGKPGRAGFVFIDFAGVERVDNKGNAVLSGGTQVHGDNLINTIIDHNYRYEWITR